MKKELNPLGLAAIVVVVAVVLIFLGYRAMKPAPYTPSPGVVANDGQTPGDTNQADTTRPSVPGESSFYPAAPPGAMPGKPQDSGSNPSSP